MINRDLDLTPEESKAVKKVERAIAALPKTITLYFHGADATVMACDAHGRAHRVGDGADLDESASLGHIRTPRCAAGDF